MARSSIDQIPPELLHPDRKASVIEWIRNTSLPSRYRRDLLQQWGTLVGVLLEGEDYIAVTEPKSL